MTDATRFAQAWAENVLPEIARLGDQALNDWIVENRNQLGECLRNAPGSWATVKAALEARHLELRNATIRQGIG